MSHLNPVLRRFSTELDDHYAQYLEELRALFRNDRGHLVLGELSDDNMRAQIQTVSARLGARCGASVKRAKRQLLQLALQTAQHQGLDITPWIANRCAERLLHRGISMRWANEHFGTPGRTAKDKSSTSPADLEQLESLVRRDLAELMQQILRIKAAHRESWQRSPQRAALLDEWRVAKQALLRDV